VTEYPHVHTAQGLREEAERCFRLAESASEKRLRQELLAYGRELVDRAERMETAERASIDAAREHNKVNSERS